MKKIKTYEETRFGADVLKEAVLAVKEVAAQAKADVSSLQLSVEHDESSWSYDTLDEFIADFRKYQNHGILSC